MPLVKPIFSPGRSSRRGAMLPLIAVLLPVVLIFLGFAVDLAYMQTTRLELQAAADAAARAAATNLSQTDSLSSARRTARDIASANTVAGAPLLLRNRDIEIGRAVKAANGRWVFSAGGAPANSVRINAPRNVGSRGGPVSLFFGSLIGTPHFQPVRSATASFLSVDVCLVLDRSSSMKLGVDEANKGMSMSDPRCCIAPIPTSRWAALDAAVQVFIAELAASRSHEQLAVVSYSSDLSGWSFCGASNKPSSLDCALDLNLANAEAAMTRLNTTVWNGNTYIESGMRTGIDALTDSSRARDTAEKIMIVMTDGHQNEGSATAAATDCAANDIVVHTVTFSSGADKNTMQNVARIARGQHYHADDAATLRDVFRELAAQTSRLTD